MTLKNSNKKNSENKISDSGILEGVETMCRVFWGPDLESCRHMMDGSFFHSFEIIIEKSEKDPPSILDNIDSIIKYSKGFESFQSLFNHLNECYVRLFVNSKEGITAPLYQSCYEFENAPMMGEAAIKMKNLFLSKGLSMENRVNEPPDHLAIELEYLFFLLQEKNGIISNEAASFAEKTMLPWVTIFNQRLKFADDDCRFYYLTSGILIRLLGLISGKE